eukprot:TRINITY_DN22780_c0_g1_i3.p1 TRINITY_DN22780_c0_g1~~TRINITY_DN22780_c0_g1_i3.p1  ORF type:complete len:151 (+),score=41.96 TRINITY_DN22780_c0_g1_i3:76-528(+)
MTWSAPPPAPQCPACKKSVFAPEAYMASDRTPFHKACLKCSKCKKSLTPASLNEHEKKLFCPLCYEDMFNPHQDDIPERSVMQVLPIQGMFTVEKKLKEEFLSPEELRKREEALAAAKAWEEATEKTDPNASSIRIMETVSIAPDDSISL